MSAPGYAEDPRDDYGRNGEQRAAMARIVEAMRLGQLDMAAANVNGAIRHLAPVVAHELIGAPLSAAYGHIEFGRAICRAAREILLPSLPDGLERLHKDESGNLRPRRRRPLGDAS